MAEQREMLADLRLGVEARAGVVEIDLAGPVEAAIFAGPQRRERIDGGRASTPVGDGR
jgi:hypothetical protein